MICHSKGFKLDIIWEEKTLCFSDIPANAFIQIFLLSEIHRRLQYNIYVYGYLTDHLLLQM